MDKAKAKKGSGEVEVVDKDPEDLKVVALVPHSQMEGLKSLWRVATESFSKQVIDGAAKFLVSLHHNVTAELSSRIPEFD